MQPCASHEDFIAFLVFFQLSFLNATKLWLVAFERYLQADFIPHIVYTFSSKNSGDIRVFVQACMPHLLFNNFYHQLPLSTGSPCLPCPRLTCIDVGLRIPLSFRLMRSHWWFALASDWLPLSLCTSVPQSCPVIGPGAHCWIAIAFISLCLAWIFAIATGGLPLGKVVTLVTLNIWYYYRIYAWLYYFRDPFASQMYPLGLIGVPRAWGGFTLPSRALHVKQKKPRYMSFCTSIFNFTGSPT